MHIVHAAPKTIAGFVIHGFELMKYALHLTTTGLRFVGTVFHRFLIPMHFPLEDLSGGEWKICTPETVGSFSGGAYFFARSLHIDQNVPVGIIHTSWSGTPCQSWISADMLYTMPEFKDKIIKEIYENDSDWSELQSLGNEKNRLREEIFQSKCEGLKKGGHK